MVPEGAAGAASAAGAGASIVRLFPSVHGDDVLAQAGEAAFASPLTEGRSAGGSSYTRAVQSDAAGRPMLEDRVLHGAGHAWSDSSQAGSFTEPRGPDASREMVAFFLRQAPESTVGHALAVVHRGTGR